MFFSNLVVMVFILPYSINLLQHWMEASKKQIHKLATVKIPYILILSMGCMYKLNVQLLTGFQVLILLWLFLGFVLSPLLFVYMKHAWVVSFKNVSWLAGVLNRHSSPLLKNRVILYIIRLRYKNSPTYPVRNIICSQFFDYTIELNLATTLLLNGKTSP